MPEFRKYIVEPSLPGSLQTVQDIAYNLWWTWNPDAVNLLRRIDGDLWEKHYHNPVKVLGSLSQERIKELEDDDGFLTHTERVKAELDEYMKEESWFGDKYGEDWNRKKHIAYLSFEFGIDECLPIYSGGLGVLAGDHLKSASDLGVPLVAVGLAYTHGYFTQYLNMDGWQQEVYPVNNFYLLPLKLMMDGDGNAYHIDIPYPGRTVRAQIWKAQVGRIPLYLLDTNIPDNDSEDRDLTSQLYGGDGEMRIKQEILLGIGAVRLLKKLGIEASAYHMNEGHAAFSGIERSVQLMKEEKMSFQEAKEAIINSSIFTTHTPVPAGNDYFTPGLLEKYIEPVIKNSDVKMPVILSLGRKNQSDAKEYFCMTVLALRLSSKSNAVSVLHGEVSRNMWHEIWPDVPTNLIPIHSITNGIHIRTWISEEMRHLFDRYLGMQWITKPGDEGIWKKIEKIPEAELWRTHERRRERLAGFARKRLAEQLRKKGASDSEIHRAEDVLDPEALTIGFARRFATYKRGTLILQDLRRLEKILNDKARPVQIIFAGKSHPSDHDGKEFIKQIYHIARKDDFRRRVVFLENYDIDLARYLVQGCDVWLNNPRRLLEASGTSGMKASANGALNLSSLDGWWVEGYEPDTGWSIGMGEVYNDHKLQDVIESRAIYDLIEQDIVPLFYNRGPDGIPRGWLKKMRSSMTKLNPVFNTNRMVREYTEKYYMPLAALWHKQVEKSPEIIKSLAKWKEMLKREWGNIRIVDIQESGSSHLKVGDKKPVRVLLDTGKVAPEDVMVECYYGPLDLHENVEFGKSATLKLEGEVDKNVYAFAGEIVCEDAGQQGYAVRVLPRNENLVRQYVPGLILWG
ncbi:MAG: alpha-glucan family phosphorylase [Nitrospinota bacterium]